MELCEGIDKQPALAALRSAKVGQRIGGQSSCESAGLLSSSVRVVTFNLTLAKK